MLEKNTVEGRPAIIAYLTANLEPASKDDWFLAKIIFEDNGEHIWVTNRPAKTDRE